MPTEHLCRRKGIPARYHPASRAPCFFKWILKTPPGSSLTSTEHPALEPNLLMFSIAVVLSTTTTTSLWASRAFFVRITGSGQASPFALIISDIVSSFLNIRSSQFSQESVSIALMVTQIRSFSSLIPSYLHRLTFVSLYPLWVFSSRSTTAGAQRPLCQLSCQRLPPRCLRLRLSFRREGPGTCPSRVFGAAECAVECNVV